MDIPMMFEPYQAAADIDVLPSFFPIPGYGILPVNAFVLKGTEPVLVDTGLFPLSDEFIEKLSQVIDPGDISWLWLSHADMDHVGSLGRILEMNPKLRIITTYLTCGRMSLFQPLPMNRVFLLNPGQSISIGDRTLTAIKPPSFDGPDTTGFYDSKAGVFFCADCFGALMTEPHDSAADLGTDELKKGMVLWATVDTPWLHMVDSSVFDRNINFIHEMAPNLILSAHLPLAKDMTNDLLDYLSIVPGSQPFVGPDQQALEMMLQGLTGR